jgi:hypothetical protein
MGTLIRLSRNPPAVERSTRIERGDSDLVPIAIILWFSSLVRIAAEAGETFGAEATLALVCSLGIPCWFAWEWVRRPGSAAKCARLRVFMKSLCARS